jgi:hypothetical protein
VVVVVADTAAVSKAVHTLPAVSTESEATHTLLEVRYLLVVVAVVVVVVVVDIDADVEVETPA